MSYKHRGARRASERERKRKRLFVVGSYTTGKHDHFVWLSSLNTDDAYEYCRPRRQRKPACTGPWATYNRAIRAARLYIAAVEPTIRISWHLEDVRKLLASE